MTSPTNAATATWWSWSTDTRRLVWAAPGRDKATVTGSFTAPGPERCQQITHVSADGAAFIADMVGQHCPDAVARPATELAHQLNGARYSLWKNPENLKDQQRDKPDWIAKTSPTLHRAYLLKKACA